MRSMNLNERINARANSHIIDRMYITKYGKYAGRNIIDFAAEVAQRNPKLVGENKKLFVRLLRGWAWRPENEKSQLGRMIEGLDREMHPDAYALNERVARAFKKACKVAVKGNVADE